MNALIMGMHCRCWEVKNMYLRGDIHDIGTMMLYIPSISNSITLINTSDTYYCATQSTEMCILYLLNVGIATVSLHNIIKFCCFPPSECTIIDIFIDAFRKASSMPVGSHWRVDRLHVEMIRVMVENGFHVECGIFAEDIVIVNRINLLYPGRLRVTSILG